MAKAPVLLCVDDESLVLESVQAQIKAHFGNAFSYEVAQSAEEAQEIIDELMAEGTPLPIVISDWLMPLKLGDAFLQDVSLKLPQAKLIMLSGHAEEDAIARARKYANLYKFIRKPWDKQVLLSTIEEAMQSWKHPA
jgi:DNA-binding NtrC family response regulator